MSKNIENVRIILILKKQYKDKNIYYLKIDLKNMQVFTKRKIIFWMICKYFIIQKEFEIK